MTRRSAMLLVLTLVWPLQSLDDSARAWVQAHRRAEWESTMRLVSNGSRPFLMILTAGALVSGTAGRAAVLDAAVALVPVNLTVEGLKWTLGRARPDGDGRRKNSAFPSSHAANAFAVAAVIAYRWRRAALPFGLFAVAVAFSRMYLDRHWLSDVSGGALIGVGGAVLGIWLVRRWRASRTVAAEG